MSTARICTIWMLLATHATVWAGQVIDYDLLIAGYDSATIARFELDAPNTPAVELDASSGILGPFGANALAFDSDGCLYIGDFDQQTIWKRCPGAAPVPIVTAEDGLQRPDGIVRLDDNLYIANRFGGNILQFPLVGGRGAVTVFDTLPGGQPMSIATNGFSKLYVATDLGELFEYVDVNSEPTRNSLGFFGTGGNVALAYDGGWVYHLDDGELLQIDPADIKARTIASDLGGHDEGLAIDPRPTKVTVFYASDYAGEVIRFTEGGPIEVFAANSEAFAGPTAMVFRSGGACAGLLRCDVNCDGNISVGDINPFVLALTDPDGYAAAFPFCNRICTADTNQNGEVSVADINDFVTCIID